MQYVMFPTNNCNVKVWIRKKFMVWIERVVSQLHAVKYLGNPLNLLSGTWPSLVGHGVLNDMDTHVKQFFSGVFEHDRAFEGACEKKKPTLPTQNGRMGSESIVYEAEGLMGYWLSGHEGKRNNCFSKIQLVAQKYRE